MLDDIRAAFRSLRISPTFTAVAVTVLALGIGAGTAVFSVVDAVVLRGLPFDEHDRLAAVLEHDTLRPETFGGGTTTTQTYLDWRRLQESFDSLAIVASHTFRLRNESGEPADARASRVTHEFFSTLRVAPLLGRTFVAADEVAGQHRVAVLSYGFWQRRFGGDPAAVGRTIELSEEPFEIVGVLPREFTYPVASNSPSEVFAPVSFREEDTTRKSGRNYNWLAIGRLKHGVSMDAAQEQMNSVATALDRQYPTWSPGRRVLVMSLHHHLVGRVRQWMLLLLGAVLLVLLIACANVANLMLARAMSRSREIGIRAALGAGRVRLVRGLLTEGLLLSLSGATLGILLAYGGVELIRAWMPATLPRVAGIAIDMRVLAVAVLAALATGLGFSLVPALHASRPDLTSCFKDGGRSTTAGRSTQWMRQGLVVIEVALAVVLLVGAGLFVGSFAKVMRVDTGIDYRNVIALNVFVRDPSFEEALKRGNEYITRQLEAIRAVPGVMMAEAASGGTPLGGGWSRSAITIGGVKHEGDNSIDRRAVTTEYLQLLRIPLKRGRYLNESDRQGSAPVMVINETAARKYWPNQDPLGQRATINSVERTIVGIVGDIRHLGPEVPARPESYAPLFQQENSGAMLLIRTQAMRWPCCRRSKRRSGRSTKNSG